jgi:hypothetical protein
MSERIELFVHEGVRGQEAHPGYGAWLASRPESVRAIALEFPLGLAVRVDGGPLLYLIGYTEDEKVIFSPVNPGANYAGALEDKVYLCASHLREAALKERGDE